MVRAEYPAATAGTFLWPRYIIEEVEIYIESTVFIVGLTDCT